MIGTLAGVLNAAIFFVASHLVLSAPPLRQALVERLGERPFRALHGAVSMLALLWLVISYVDAPYVEIWAQAPWMRLVPLVVMPFAAILLVCGVTAARVTATRGKPPPPTADAVPGILKITRHPNLWAAALWASAHMVPNGDAAALMLFSAMLVLAFVGMPLSTSRRRQALGAAWGPIELTTSVIPFAALISGRARLRFAEIGASPILGGIALYLAALLLHPLLIGVSPLPV